LNLQERNFAVRLFGTDDGLLLQIFEG
jgi:hypothetical protein